MQSDKLTAHRALSTLSYSKYIQKNSKGICLVLLALIQGAIIHLQTACLTVLILIQSTFRQIYNSSYPYSKYLQSTFVLHCSLLNKTKVRRHRHLLLLESYYPLNVMGPCVGHLWSKFQLRGDSIPFILTGHNNLFCCNECSKLGPHFSFCNWHAKFSSEI